MEAEWVLLLPKWKQNITKKKTRLKAKRQKSVKQELQFQMKFNGFVFVLRCFLTPVGDCSSNVKTQDMAITAQNNRHHQYHRPSLLPSPYHCHHRCHYKECVTNKRVFLAFWIRGMFESWCCQCITSISSIALRFVTVKVNRFKIQQKKKRKNPPGIINLWLVQVKTDEKQKKKKKRIPFEKCSQRRNNESDSSQSQSQRWS